MAQGASAEEKVPLQSEEASLHPPASTPIAPAGSLTQPSDWWPLATELLEV